MEAQKITTRTAWSALLILASSALLNACSGGDRSEPTPQTPSPASTTPQPVLPPTSPPIATPPVSVSLFVDKGHALAGEMATLTWTSTNATDCIASGDWSGNVPTNGSQQVGPFPQETRLMQYTLRCFNVGSSASQFAGVISHPAPVGFFFEISDRSVRDAVWNDRQKVFYLAIGSGDEVYGNSIVAFDPVTGTVMATVPARSEPISVDLSDDGSFLYAAFNGADVINRYSVPDLILTKSFPVDPAMRASKASPAMPVQIAVAPGSPLTVAVASWSIRSLPPDTRVSVLDDGVQRPFAFFLGDRGFDVAWGNNSSKLFAAQFGGNINAISTGPTGATVVGTTMATSGFSAFSIFSAAYGNGLLYDTKGGVFDGVSLNRVGTLPKKGVVTIDKGNGRVFAAEYDEDKNNTIITTYDPGSDTPRDSVVVTRFDTKNLINITPGRPRKISRWGTNGLALTDGNRFTILWGDFVGAGSATTPVGKLPATTCCNRLFSATEIKTSIVANDILWSPTHKLFLASVPNESPDHPNTIAILDEVTGNPKSYVPTVAQPGALAISDDSQYLYVASTYKLQRFRLPALTLEATVDLFPNPPTTAPHIANTPKRMLVRPHDPHTVAIDGHTFVTNMSRITDRVFQHATSVQWSLDGNTLFGIESDSTGMNSWSAPFATSVMKDLGSPLIYPFSANADYPWGITFHQVGGLLYSDTGAVYDPVTGGWPGTLPIGPTFPYNRGTSFGLGTLAFDSARRRVFSITCNGGNTFGVCSNELQIFDADKYLVVGSAILQETKGWAWRLLQLNATTFAILTAGNEVVLTKSPEYAR